MSVTAEIERRSRRLAIALCAASVTVILAIYGLLCWMIADQQRTIDDLKRDCTERTP